MTNCTICYINVLIKITEYREFRSSFISMITIRSHILHAKCSFVIDINIDSLEDLYSYGIEQ